MNRGEHYCSYTAFKTTRTGDYRSGTTTGFLMSRLGYIISGSCTVTEGSGNVLNYEAGDIMYVPKKRAYTSDWRGNGDISLCIIEFDADFFSCVYTDFKRIRAEDMRGMFEMLAEPKGNDTFASASTFYSILDKVTEKMGKKSEQISAIILPAIRYIAANYTANIKVSELARMCFMGDSYFYRYFKKVLGQTPIEYKNRIKINHAVDMIKSNLTMEEICERLNFSSPAFLRRLLKKYTAKTPREIKMDYYGI